MANVKFTATKLVGTGKRGVLKPDANGYYSMPIGGLNAFNSVGEYYTLEGAKDLFQSSSVFMRRVGNGCLKGELGHPKQAPGMSMDAYINRIMTIEETNIVAHFSEVWLDETYGKQHPEFKNSGLVAIMAKVKPTGPHAASLQASFDNPDENVCFSIRALTNDYYERGQKKRVLTSIVTWDQVNEGGIFNASKWSSPSLESLAEARITVSSLEKLIADKECVATEDSKAIAKEALQSIVTLPTIPLYSKW